MSHFVGCMCLFNSGSRVATADDSGDSGSGTPRQHIDNGVGALCESRHFSHSKRAIPYNGLCICQGLVECFDGFGTDIEDTPTGGNVLDRDNSGCGVGGETVGYYHVDGQQQVQVALTGLGDEVTSHIEFTLFEQRVADLVPLGLQEGVCHTATDEQDVDHADETLQDGDFVGDLGPADDSGKGPPWMLKRRSEEVDFLLHQETCHAWQVMGDAFGRGMGTVSGAEGIVDVDFTKRGKLARKIRVILFLFLVEAEV